MGRCSDPADADRRRWWTDENGAAASVEFTLALPFFVLLICLFVEVVLMVLAKAGVAYAAFGAARSAGAWLAVRPAEAPHRAHRAAVQALVPFASGDDNHRRGPTGSAAMRYSRAFSHAFPPDLVAARFAYADRAMQVEVRKEGGGAEARVTFLYPFRVAIIGRAIGERAPWAPGPWVFRIRSTSVVPTAIPQGKLGIDYDPR